MVHYTYPSFFSRLFEINEAFSVIHASYNYNYDGVDNGSSIYHKLTSDCLDLIEMIYLYGNSNKFEFRKIDLPVSVCNEYVGIIKEDFHSDLPLFDGLYIILWDGKVIGGFSPLTIVYTAPNIEEIGINVLGTNGNVLFGKTATPYSKRSDYFKVYLLNMINIAPNLSNTFKYYIERCTRNLSYQVECFLRESDLDKP